MDRLDRQEDMVDLPQSKFIFSEELQISWNTLFLILNVKKTRQCYPDGGYECHFRSIQLRTHFWQDANKGFQN